jgi:hypothetical protein
VPGFLTALKGSALDKADVFVGKTDNAIRVVKHISSGVPITALRPKGTSRNGQEQND